MRVRKRQQFGAEWKIYQSRDVNFFFRNTHFLEPQLPTIVLGTLLAVAGAGEQIARKVAN